MMFGLRRRHHKDDTVPRRSSSVVSITSLSQSVDDSTTIDDCGYSSIGSLFRFDSSNLQSTKWRNKQMLSSITTPPTYIHHFGVEVCFTEQFHYTKAELEPYRKVGDEEMDELLQYLSQNKDGCGCGPFDDVISYIAKEYQANCDADTPTVQFYKHYYENIPYWVDFEQIQRGIDVFLAYLPVAGCSLFYRSLVGGFSIPEIVEVLQATQYLVGDKEKSVERLLDTGGFLACCFAPSLPTAKTDTTSEVQSASSLRPGGKGWEAALRVRVLHAKVRRSLLQSKRRVWDVETNGIPINQEDLAATLLAFSVNVLLGIEIIAGKPLPENEQYDYLALWRYIGWLLGVDTVETEEGRSSNASKHSNLPPIDPCGGRKLGKTDANCQEDILFDDGNSIIHSYTALESMILHLLHPKKSSCDLVSHLLNLRRFVIFRSEVCRTFLGQELSDELDISRSTIKWKGLKWETFNNVMTHLVIKFFVYSFLIFLRVYTVMTMSFSWTRRRAIKFHAVLETKFLIGWQQMNAKRVTRAKATIKNSDPKSISNCPFSMIMPPVNSR